MYYYVYEGSVGAKRERGQLDVNNETNLNIYQENHKDAKGRVILASVLRRL